jgi:cyclopropane-fatty-acyl-phospholipid synthase
LLAERESRESPAGLERIAAPVVVAGCRVCRDASTPGPRGRAARSLGETTHLRVGCEYPPADTFDPNGRHAISCLPERTPGYNARPAQGWRFHPMRSERWAMFDLRLFSETLIYGPAYSALQRLIRSPTSLDPGTTWKIVTDELPPLADWMRVNYPPGFVRRLLLAPKLRQQHVVGIADHYDVSNEFYKLFLDKKFMFYSCADFHSENDTLEEAQTNKANFLLKLIEPQPGEKILELGCGWGAMLKHIHEATGDKENLHGYTLSKAQVAYNQEHHGFKVEFKNFVSCDYPTEYFDKIYSIGAWEHVRQADVPTTLRKLYASLKPGGRMVKQFFCFPSEAVPVAVLAAQIFFPGSLMPPYPVQVRSFERAGFRIVHQSVHDYRPTLASWFLNLVDNRERAIELVGARTFNKYLVFFPASYRFFNEVAAILFRFVLEKPRTSAAKKSISGSSGLFVR